MMQIPTQRNEKKLMFMEVYIYVVGERCTNIFVCHSHLSVAVACPDPSTSIEYKYVSTTVNIKLKVAIKKLLNSEPP